MGKNTHKNTVPTQYILLCFLPKFLVRLAAFFCLSPTRRLSACVITEPMDCNGLSKKIDGHLRFVLGQASWGTRSKMVCYWSCQQKPDLRILNQQPKLYDMVYEALKNTQSLAPLDPKCWSLPTHLSCSCKCYVGTAAHGNWAHDVLACDKDPNIQYHREKQSKRRPFTLKRPGPKCSKVLWWQLKMRPAEVVFKAVNADQSRVSMVIYGSKWWTHMDCFMKNRQVWIATSSLTQLNTTKKVCQADAWRSPARNSTWHARPMVPWSHRMMSLSYSHGKIRLG